MWPSFEEQVRPALSKVLHKWYFEAAAIHAVLGITAELYRHRGRHSGSSMVVTV